MTTSMIIRFALEVGGVPDGAFRVQEFTLEEGISECFRLAVAARCQDCDTDVGDLIGRPAALMVDGEGFPTRHRGIITEARLHPDSSRDSGKESHLYAFTIRPAFLTLSYSLRSRIFLNKDAMEIIKEVLRESGLVPGDFRSEVAGPLPRREFTVQYNETDLNFVERLLEDEGIFYFFDNRGERDAVVFADRASSIQVLPDTPALPFHPLSGLSHLAEDHVFQVHRCRKLATGKVTIKDYNDRTPKVIVQGNAAGGGFAELYAFSPHVKTPDEASRLAGLRLEMLAGGDDCLEGEGVCRAIRCGFRFSLEGAPAFDGQYAIVRAVHHGDRREGFGGDRSQPTYTTRFTGIPAGKAFRPPMRAERPRIPGLLLAKADGLENSYASLDEEGRYHAKLPFDLSDRRDGQASLPIRLSQPYAGPGYGMHFPVHNGNDLVLGFIGGDVDRPIALGALPNPANASPVAARNKSESVIKTASGHCLRMDDKDGHSIVDLATAGEHYLALNDDPAEQGILLATKGEHMLILDDTGTRITVKSKYGHELTLDDGAKSITLKTNGGHQVVLDDTGKSLTFEDGDGKTRVFMDGRGGNVEITASGNISLSAGKSLSISAGDNLSASAGKDASLSSGKNTTLSATDNHTASAGKAMNLEAGDKLRSASKAVSAEAQDTLQLNGKKILGKAQSEFQVEGAKVNIKASSNLVLKGSNVKQN